MNASCVFGFGPKTNFKKKRFFLNIERFLSYLTFYPLTKVAASLVRVEKKFLQNCPQRVSKEAECCADFKNVLNLAKGKQNFTEKLIY
jgi:hypothetical protein